MRVRDAMTRDVVGVRPDEQAATAATTLLRAGVSGLPVVTTDGVFVGTVTPMDLIRARRYGADLHELSVSDVACRHARCIAPDADLFDAVRQMEAWQLPNLPVVEHGRLNGIISRQDVLRALTPTQDRWQTVAPVRAIAAPCGSGRACACISTARTQDFGDEA